MDLSKLDPKKSLLDALLLSIAKWKYIFLNGGSKEDIFICIPELKYIYCGCGMCERYFNDIKTDCHKCEIAKTDMECSAYNSIWARWYREKNPEKKLFYAKMMLFLLRKLYWKELDRIEKCA